ncbi:pectin acetylesterase-family hydrolase [Lujinxingia litoralis]|nr:pectin acetylesterase-family hydrolase [Lujinxingia litoralis]
MKGSQAMRGRWWGALLILIALGGCVLPPGLRRSNNPQVEVELWRPEAGLVPGRWTYVEVEGARCANGSAVGAGFSAGGQQGDLVVYFNGGGACWDALSCGILETAANTDRRYSHEQLAREVYPLEKAGLLSREEGTNPLRDAHFLFVPYCTGDLHAGANTITYPGLGLEGPVHHQGRRNVELFVERARTFFPHVERVWLMGVSAGGYAVTLNFELFKEAFPHAEVHAFADASPWLTLEEERWASWRASWAMTLPAQCQGCLENSQLIPTRLAETYPGSRFALSVFSHDAVISTYFGASPATFNTLLEALVLRYQEGPPNMRVFVAEGGDHETLLQLRTLRGVEERRLEDFFLRWVQGEESEDGPGE